MPNPYSFGHVKNDLHSQSLQQCFCHNETYKKHIRLKFHVYIFVHASTLHEMCRNEIHCNLVITIILAVWQNERYDETSVIMKCTF